LNVPLRFLSHCVSIEQARPTNTPYFLPVSPYSLSVK
jgi:hypothetical protein